MLEIFEGNIDKYHASLRFKLAKFATNPKRRRREIVKVDFGSIPPDMSLFKVEPEELFVNLVEKVFQAQTVIPEQVAKKLLIKASQAADVLEDLPGGNDAFGKFLYESLAYLNNANPQMGEDVKKIMDAAARRSGERALKQAELFKRWINNQRR